MKIQESKLRKIIRSIILEGVSGDDIEDLDAYKYIDQAYSTDGDYIFNTEMIDDDKTNEDEDFLKVKDLFNQTDGDYSEFIFIYSNYLRKKDGLAPLTKEEFYIADREYNNITKDQVKDERFKVRSSMIFKALSRFNSYNNIEKLQKRNSNFYIYCASVGAALQLSNYDKMGFIAKAGLASSEAPWLKLAPVIYQLATGTLDNKDVVYANDFNWTESDWAFVFNYLTIYWNCMRVDYNKRNLSYSDFNKKYNFDKRAYSDFIKECNLSRKKGDSRDTVIAIINKMNKEDLPIHDNVNIV